jgi:hypothetical protein
MMQVVLASLGTKHSLALSSSLYQNELLAFSILPKTSYESLERGSTESAIIQFRIHIARSHVESNILTRVQTTKVGKLLKAQIAEPPCGRVANPR